MKYIWFLFELAITKIEIVCRFKCKNLREGTVVKCEDYLRDKISSNTFRYKTRNFKWLTSSHHLSLIDHQYQYNEFSHPSNQFQALKNYDSCRGANESTYLNMLIASRVKDFLNSASRRRETSDEISIDNSSYEDVVENDYDEILSKVVTELTFKEQAYLRCRYTDNMSYKEIANSFGIEEKQASKKVENIQKKLKRKLEKLGYSFEDII